MGCITFAVKRKYNNINIVAKKHPAIKISALLCNKMKTVIFYYKSFNVKVLFDSNIKIKTSFEKRLKTNVSLVCTVNYYDGNEIWWCDQWRVLWNNGVKTLWLN